tara:strand:- start:417 stop:2120 length:1704 start_codon:yes stop_codon:yes gene_type:complete
MDKLKPLIVHKFWIILFIALLLPVVGWSMATGNLAKEIDERKAAIDKAFTDAQVPPNPPNETWSTALQQINKEKDIYIGQSHKYLWDKQQSLFVWPPDIAPLMKNTPYRGEISRVPRNLYRSAYKFEILRAHKLANPFNLRDGTGTVDIAVNVIPHVPLDKWKTLPPTSEEMWDAQEDVWLVSSIMEAIAKVNKGAANISESAVRQISVLELRGGTVGDTGEAPLGGDGMMEPGMGGDMPGASPFGGGGARVGGMQDGKDGMQNISVDMDLVKIFGNDLDAAAGGGEDAGGMESPDAGMMPGGLGGGFGGMGAAQNLKRYYHEEEELPYKTRAFYIKAVIQSGKLPNLMAELTNMPWPAEIVRVQRADMFDDNLSPIATLGGGTGGGMRGRGGSAGADAGFGIDGGFGAPGSGSGFDVDMGVGGIPGSGQGQGLENKGLLDAALSDPELAVVTIAGLMTLYKPYVPPEGDAVAQTEGGAENNSGQPAADAAALPADATAIPQPAATPDSVTTPGENPANPDQPNVTPAGTSPAEPTESAPPQQPADPKPDESQPPQAEPEPADAVNQ